MSAQRQRGGRELKAPRDGRPWLAGTLSALTIIEVVQLIFTSLKSGVLRLSFAGPGGAAAGQRPHRRSLYFREGQLVFAASSEPSDRLGPVLWRAGLLGWETLVRCERLGRAGPAARPGAGGRRRPHRRAISTPASPPRSARSSSSAFLDTEGEFLFVEGPHGELNEVRLPERTRDLLLEGLKRVEETERLLAVVGGRGARLQPRRGAAARRQRVHAPAPRGAGGEPRPSPRRPTRAGSGSWPRCARRRRCSRPACWSGAAEPPGRPPRRASRWRWSRPRPAGRRAGRHARPPARSSSTGASSAGSTPRWPRPAPAPSGGSTATSTGCRRRGASSSRGSRFGADGELDVARVLANVTATGAYRGAGGQGPLAGGAGGPAHLRPLRGEERAAQGRGRAAAPRGGEDAGGEGMTAGRRPDLQRPRLRRLEPRPSPSPAPSPRTSGCSRWGWSSSPPRGRRWSAPPPRWAARSSSTSSSTTSPPPSRGRRGAPPPPGPRCSPSTPAAGAEMVRAAVRGAGGRLRVLAVTVLTSLDGAALDAIGLAGPPEAAVVRLARLAVEAGAGGLVCSPQEVAAVRAAVGPGAAAGGPGGPPRRQRPRRPGPRGHAGRGRPRRRRRDRGGPAAPRRARSGGRRPRHRRRAGLRTAAPRLRPPDAQGGPRAHPRPRRAAAGGPPAAAAPGPRPPPVPVAVANAGFERGLEGWTASGTAVGHRPGGRPAGRGPLAGRGRARGRRAGQRPLRAGDARGRQALPALGRGPDPRRRRRPAAALPDGAGRLHLDALDALHQLLAVAGRRPRGAARAALLRHRRARPGGAPPRPQRRRHRHRLLRRRAPGAARRRHRLRPAGAGALGRARLPLRRRRLDLRPRRGRALPARPAVRRAGGAGAGPLPREAGGAAGQGRPREGLGQPAAAGRRAHAAPVRPRVPGGDEGDRRRRREGRGQVQGARARPARRRHAQQRRRPRPARLGGRRSRPRRSPARASSRPRTRPTRPSPRRTAAPPSWPPSPPPPPAASSWGSSSCGTATPASTGT